eukprot:7341086-Pyramimonas_sp.AAC.1
MACAPHMLRTTRVAPRKIANHQLHHVDCTPYLDRPILHTIFFATSISPDIECTAYGAKGTRLVAHGGQ